MPIPLPDFADTRRQLRDGFAAAREHHLLAKRYTQSPVASLRRDEAGKGTELDRVRKALGRPGSPFSRADLKAARKALQAATEAVERQTAKDLILAGDLAKAASRRCEKCDCAWTAYATATKPTISALEAEIEGLTARLASACRTLATVRGDHVGSLTGIAMPFGKRVLLASAPVHEDHAAALAASLAIRGEIDRMDGDLSTTVPTKEEPADAVTQA